MGEQAQEYDAQGKPLPATTTPAPASSATEYDASGKPITSTPAPPADTRNGLQKAVDAAATPDTDAVRQKRTQFEQGIFGNKVGKFAGGLENFGNDLTQGLTKGLVQPLVHPIDTATGILKSGAANVANLTDPTGHVAHAVGLPSYADSARSLVSGVKAVPQNVRDQGGLVHAIPSAVGNVAGTMALGELGGRVLSPAARSTGNLFRSGAANLDNAAIGTSAGDTAFGANPGRALSTNRVIGSSAATIAPKVRSLIPQAVAEHRGIVASNPRNATINTGHLVSDPFQDIITDKTNARTGAANPAQVNRASNTQRLLTHVPDSSTGKPTPLMRDPNLSPLEATHLKSNIYDMTDYDNPSQSALANKGLKGAAHNLKAAVDKAVPESIPSGQRLHDLMAAKDVIEPAARLVKLPTSKAGILDRGATLAATSGAAGMDATGAGLQHLSRFLTAPALRALPIIPALQKRQDKK